MKKLSKTRFAHESNSLSNAVACYLIENFNKVEIYTGYVAMMVFGYPLYPEISIEMWFMLFPSSEGKELIFDDDFFLKSRIVKKAIGNYTKPQRLTWHPSHYNLGESEARVALTFNGGTLHIENDTIQVKVPCAWPRYSDYRDHSAKTPLVRFPKIEVQEGLFWILETAISLSDKRLKG